MAFVILVAGFVFYSIFPSLAFASCAGVKGCNPCYDSLLGTSKEDVVCSADADCVAIPHRCDDYYAVNKASSAKFLGKKLSLPKSKKPPILECKFDEGWGAQICRAKK